MTTDPLLVIWSAGCSAKAEGGYEVIWILLAALGVPLWLIVGALGGALWSRRQFRHAPGVFPCKIRIVSGSGGAGKWTRSTAHARWVHDVLLVHVGLALVRFRALPVAGVDAPVSPASDVKLKGGDVVSAPLRLDDGSVVEDPPERGRWQRCSRARSTTSARRRRRTDGLRDVRAGRWGLSPRPDRRRHRGQIYIRL